MKLFGEPYAGKRLALYVRRGQPYMQKGISVCGERGSQIVRKEKPCMRKGLAIRRNGDMSNSTHYDYSISHSKHKNVLQIVTFVTSTFCLPQKYFLNVIRIFFLNLEHSTSNRRQVLKGFLQYLLCFPNNKN